MQGKGQCKKQDECVSQCGEFDNSVTLNDNSDPLWAEEREGHSASSSWQVLVEVHHFLLQLYCSSLRCWHLLCFLVALSCPVALAQAVA
ncbi:hypothetical protein F7725_000055 [Dissostichus mawsoni]|uniref:Uncharacterized protein n=1 Tax=Dissostichus mawsoni TaxID=36200 RepID=A0A7J5ZDY3_DISMA|nr:hypothetical protein F7725_000055 [Dissostichus mawsoni]